LTKELMVSIVALDFASSWVIPLFYYSFL